MSKYPLPVACDETTPLPPVQRWIGGIAPFQRAQPGIPFLFEHSLFLYQLGPGLQILFWFTLMPLIDLLLRHHIVTSVAFLCWNTSRLVPHLCISLSFQMLAPGHLASPMLSPYALAVSKVCKLLTNVYRIWKDSFHDYKSLDSLYIL